ncbi:MAG: hypothetical protein RIR24_759 [Actinomycetota bacterium]|jgi:hypothetical protein
MKKLFWFATGIAAGLAVAKQLRENPEAKIAIEDAAKRARAIGEAFTNGYKEREVELSKASSKPASKAGSKTAVKKLTAKKPAAKRPTTSKSPTK